MSQSIDGTPGSSSVFPADASSNPPRTRNPWFRRGLFFLVLFGAVAAGLWYYKVKKPGGAAVQYRTTPLARGDILQEVTANGSLNAVTNVEVGSQVSGIIEKINVDFNSHVKEGDVIAQIDPSEYQQDLIRAEADLANGQAALELADVNARRAEELFKDKLISAADHDTAVASLHQAKATVKTREASVYAAKVKLSRTTITAPISGVVISRAVDRGQTVAANFNTPKLFVIANDLTQMQIEAAVSEADVGGVEEGQSVGFSVDAFPNQKFLGRVHQVRFAPVTNQNVVTYTAVVGASNPDLKLRPGMTATVKIKTAEKKNVLRVPNSALRFRPPQGAVVVAQASASDSTNRGPAVATDASGMPIAPWRSENRRPNPGEREKWEASLTPEQREKVQQFMQQMRQRFAEGGGGGGAGGPGGGQRPARAEGPTTATVYLLDQPSSSTEGGTATLKSVTIKAGITDGSFTEVLDGLKEGDLVVAGIIAGGSTTSAEPPRNPFSPFGGGGPRPARR